MDNHSYDVSRRGVDPVAWGPRRAWQGGAAAVGAVALAWVVIAPNTEDRLVAGVLALVSVAVVLGWQRLRVRLAADADGLTVGTLFARRRLAWSRVNQVRAVPAGRFGRRVFVVEIEARRGDSTDPLDDELFVFGASDLGADPADVARVLNARRPH